MDLKAQYEQECDKFNDAQQRFYRASAEKTNAESDMTSSRETIENLEKQLQQSSRSPGCSISDAERLSWLIDSGCYSYLDRELYSETGPVLQEAVRRRIDAAMSRN